MCIHVESVIDVLLESEREDRSMKSSVFAIRSFKNTQGGNFEKGRETHQGRFKERKERGQRGRVSLSVDQRKGRTKRINDSKREGTTAS